MSLIKKYTADAFKAITSLGTAFFYIILILFLFSISKAGLAIYLALGLVICYTFVFILRLFYFKERPKKEEYTSLFTKINASSFPSLHTMGSIYTAIVLSNEIKRPPATALFLLVAFLIAYSRIYLKKHYLIDVFTGLILGVILGVIYLFVLG